MLVFYPLDCRGGINPEWHSFLAVLTFGILAKNQAQ
jgi:hypothetical protein